MAFHNISKSTKRRRFLEELKMLDYIETDQLIEPHTTISPQNVPCSSTSSNNYTYTELNSKFTITPPELNLSFDFDYNNDACSDKSNNSSLTSDSDIEELYDNTFSQENSFLKSNSSILNKLSEWAVLFNITNAALSALLKILKTHNCHSYFPIDARTILKNKSSKNNLQVQTVPPGIFLYFKIQNALNLIYNSNSQYFFDDTIKIVIGVDGLPLSKSSSSCFWPILGYIRTVKPGYLGHVDNLNTNYIVLSMIRFER